MMMNFWEPFLSNVFKWRWGCNTEADQEDVGLWVREGTKTVVVLLTSSIEQTERIGFITNPKEAPSLAMVIRKAETLPLERIGKVGVALKYGKKFHTYMTVTA